ncbi:protocadherin gamma-C5-like isoform X11 [Astyanax mexicanus]|uniref:protocadherin gamma-C5-like isoform X11 n=1 Tax=Astyanax mexicanus TaxID=7994 RepID=UPI0020CB4380|nr:protocadherin gamma-C5-like isoform X11 [Astyanax mexicanus]
MFAEMGRLIWKTHISWQLLWLLCLSWNTIDAQIRYSIPEELKTGSVVGNIAKDLELKLSDIFDRKLQIAAETGKQYFGVDLGKGELIVTDRVDREEICGSTGRCTLTLEAIIENPLQMYRVEIDVQDVNDNSPFFLNNQIVVNVEEAKILGTRFRLESAKDPDVGLNSLHSYMLSKNEYFTMNVKNMNGSKIPELVLEKALDREKQSTHSLILTAVDGGTPARSGSTTIIIRVQDSNDNSPVFEKNSYKVRIPENTPKTTVILTVKAKDLDEGTNAEVVYSFEPNTPAGIQDMFSIDPEQGTIIINTFLDFELVNSYIFEVIASDKGASPLEGSCSVEIEILDINDNVPEILMKSLPKPVKEDAVPGTVVALIGAKDSDSGDNGKVNLSIQSGLPFTLKPSISNYYALVTNSYLDHENVPKYTVEIIARDLGTPPLQSKTQISVDILDVNDNPPFFHQPSYTVYVKENVGPGNVLFTVLASDPDQGENAKMSYSILESNIKGISVSSYFYINAENGSIFSMHSFDYEKIKVFQIQVQAKDNGSPSLSSNATVYVFIIDQNDNAPSVIYPSAVMGSHQRMPRSAKAGHLVTKVTAVDADSGHNAWISYRLAEATDTSLFSVNLHTGEVRTKRLLSEQEDSSQRLLIEIQDNGEPVQSSTVTVDVLIEDGFHEPISDYPKKSTDPNKKSGKITLYLIISLASVSLLCLMTFFMLLAKCARSSRGSSSCCIRRSDSGYKNPNRNLQIQLNTDGPIKYVEVLGGDMMSQSQSFGSCLSPMSEFSDFTLVKPSSTTDFTDTLNVLDASLPDSTWKFESQQQKPPNNDWRMPPNQRPGPSGQHRFHTLQQRWTPYEKSRAGPRPEEAGAGAVGGTGPWPNPPTEAEQLQALMAAANANEATATLGPRYNAQYVPDYRQNVYIPGSTATLTANPQQQQMPQQALPPPQALPPTEAPKAAPTPASKKKVTKKDKK